MDVRELLTSCDQVLVALDGPAAELPPMGPAADSLRAMVAHARLPRKVARTRDPLAVLEYAATIGPATATAVHTQLGRLELDVAISGRPTPGVAEAMKAMAAAGTKIVVVGSVAPAAVRAFVRFYDLDAYVWRVAGRGGPDCSVLPPAPDLLTEAIRGRAAEDCVFVGGTNTDLAAGRAAGISTYRYRRPAEPEVEPAGLPWFEALSPLG